MFQAACIHHGKTLDVWQCTKFEVASLLTPEPALGTVTERWMQAATRHCDGGETTGSALEAIRVGMSFLESASTWYRRRAETGDDHPS